MAARRVGHLLQRQRPVEHEPARPDAASVAAVHFIEQARVLGGVEYDPLFTIDCPADDIAGLSCWPSEPKYELLENGDALRGFNLEFKWSGWPGVGLATIRAGVDYDLLVLGISRASPRNLACVKQVADQPLDGTRPPLSDAPANHMATSEACGDRGRWLAS